MSGQVYGIGVGPGDPELITLKGLRLLQAAPVIAYPAPESGPSLARRIAAPHLSGTQQEIVIRMPLDINRFPAEAAYAQAAQEIGAALDAGQDVAVICEGDPFFYGSFMYLFARLVDRYPVTVVPGVSSLTACAAALARPLAARNQTLTVLPGPLPAEQLKARLTECDAAAIIKVGRHLDKIARVLDELGLAEDARYIEHATMAKQRILALKDVAGGAAPYFSMILVQGGGEGVR